MSNKILEINTNDFEDSERMKKIRHIKENTISVEKSEGVMQVKFDENDKPIDTIMKIMNTFGTNSIEAAELLINQVNLIDNYKKRTPEKINQMLKMIAGISPHGEVEAMLATQMVVAHTLSIECSKRALLDDQTFEGMEANLKFATKFMRTYTQQMEALKRYRKNSDQKMTIEHVHVNDGGQAIIGNVNGGTK